MADVEEIRERLAMIQRTIEGVKRAYEYAPQSLPPSDLPAFVNFVGPSMENWQALGSNYDQEGRTFIMRLFVKGVQQGVDGEAEKACEPFLERVRDAFSGRPGLGLGHSSGSAGRPLDGVMGAYLVYFPAARIKTLMFFRIFDIPAWFYLGFWMVLQCINGVLDAAGGTSGVAWLAHIGGFLFGLLVAGLDKMICRVRSAHQDA